MAGKKDPEEEQWQGQGRQHRLRLVADEWP
jgi:hypothetical protein